MCTKGLSAEATEGGSIGIVGMKLWKVVTVVRSGDDRWLVLSSELVCDAVTVEVNVFAAKGTAVSTVEQNAASVAWTVASAA